MKLDSWTKIAQRFNITPANDRETEKMTRLQQESSVDCYHNRPFPNYLWPLFQSESWCSSFHMKISFDSHANAN